MCYTYIQLDTLNVKKKACFSIHFFEKTQKHRNFSTCFLQCIWNYRELRMICNRVQRNQKQWTEVENSLCYRFLYDAACLWKSCTSWKTYVICMQDIHTWHVRRLNRQIRTYYSNFYTIIRPESLSAQLWRAIFKWYFFGGFFKMIFNFMI